MAEYGTAVLRITLGGIYLMQAYLALFVATPRGTAAFIAKTAGPPMPTLVALGVIAILGVGGGLLVLGTWTRLAAGANAAILLAAVLAAYFRQGTLIRGPLIDLATGRGLPAGHEYVLLLLAASLAVAMIGPGAWTLGASK
jgi:putative oxidoreductase